MNEPPDGPLTVARWLHPMLVALTVLVPVAARGEQAGARLRVGVAEVKITPPIGIPLAGYYPDRLPDGMSDPVQAKVLVFRDSDTAAALVVYDLIGTATEISREVRRRAAVETGIPEARVVVPATHSHAAPDDSKERFFKC